MPLTRNQLKQLFRQAFPVKAGGPTNVARATTTINVLDALADNMALTTEVATPGGFTPIPENWRGTHPAAATLMAALEYIYTRLANGASVITPAAPTMAVVDDTANTFSGVAVPGYTTPAQYEVFFPGSGGFVGVATVGGYAAGGRIVVPGIAGNAGPGTVGLRVAATGAQPAGYLMTNEMAFTAPAPAPAPATYSHSLLIPAGGAAQSGMGVTFSGFAGAKLEFNGKASTGALPIHLDLFIGTVLSAGLDFEGNYAADLFRFTAPNGTIYAGAGNTFQDTINGLTLS